MTIWVKKKILRKGLKFGMWVLFRFFFLIIRQALVTTNFSSFTNSTKEARLLRNEEVKIKLSQLIIQIHKLSLTAFKTKTRVVKVKHDLLHIISQVNQSKTNH